MSISIITNLHEVIFYRTEAHKNVDTNYLSEQKYTYKSSDYQFKGTVRIFVWVCFLKSYPFLDGLFQWFNLLFYLLNFFFTCELYKKPFPSFLLLSHLASLTKPSVLFVQAFWFQQRTRRWAPGKAGGTGLLHPPS